MRLAAARPPPPKPARHPRDGVGVVVFAHTPPPHHGQSMMVEIMLEGFQHDAPSPLPAAPRPPPAPPRLRVFHVNARVSRQIEDVGRFRPGKLLLLLGHVVEALWLRFRHRVRIFYYVPAPPARTPLWRDWIVMGLCRPFFPRLVFHWHAGGLSEWLETRARPWERWLSQRLLGHPDLSIVLRPFHRRDAEYLHSRRVLVLPNGIPDPCPHFDRDELPRRQAAAAARQAAWRQGPAAGPVRFRLLYLSVCRREKGIFDALEAVAGANACLRETPLRVELTVAGSFVSTADEEAFAQRVQAPDLNRDGPMVHYVGFVTGETKTRLLREADCLCLPTQLPEGFPLTLLEAMAHGLPVLCSDYRQLPEILPPGYPGVIPAGVPAAWVSTLVHFARADYEPWLRRWFTEHYAAARFATGMQAALLEV